MAMTNMMMISAIMVMTKNDEAAPRKNGIQVFICIFKLELYHGLEDSLLARGILQP